MQGSPEVLCLLEEIGFSSHTQTLEMENEFRCSGRLIQVTGA